MDHLRVVVGVVLRPLHVLVKVGALHLVHGVGALDPLLVVAGLARLVDRAAPDACGRDVEVGVQVGAVRQSRNANYSYFGGSDGRDECLPERDNWCVGRYHHEPSPREGLSGRRMRSTERRAYASDWHDFSASRRYKYVDRHSGQMLR